MSKFDEHRMEAFHENVAFLRSAGLNDEAIARRLGVSKDLLQKREERRSDGDSNP